MAGPKMSIAQANEVLQREVVRLRSGAGGYGGRSPQALILAQAIEMAIEPVPEPDLDAVIAHLHTLAQQEERAAEAVLLAAAGGRQPDDSEQHDHAAAVLRAAAEDIARRSYRSAQGNHQE